MGIFNAANQWRGAILFLPGSMSAIVLPLLSNLHGSKDRANFNKVLRYNALLNTGIAVLAALIISTLSVRIMSSYGKDFASGSWTLVFLSVSAVLSASAAVIGQAIASKGWMWWGFLLNFIWGCVLMVCFVFLSNKGALGLAGANMIAYAVHLMIVLIFTAVVLRDHGKRSA
jgi:O-antigen/teichoic acid export membrane protein